MTIWIAFIVQHVLREKNKKQLGKRDGSVAQKVRRKESPFFRFFGWSRKKRKQKDICRNNRKEEEMSI
jgi:hypothetical protein